MGEEIFLKKFPDIFKISKIQTTRKRAQLCCKVIFFSIDEQEYQIKSCRLDFKLASNLKIWDTIAYIPTDPKFVYVLSLFDSVPMPCSYDIGSHWIQRKISVKV